MKYFQGVWVFLTFVCKKNVLKVKSINLSSALIRRLIQFNRWWQGKGIAFTHKSLEPCQVSIQKRSLYEKKNSLYVKSDSLKSSSPTDVGSGERSHSQLRDRDFTTRRLTDTTMMSEVTNICSNITLVNSFILCDCIISVTFQICDIFSRWWRTGTRWRWRLSIETLQRPFYKSVSYALLPDLEHTFHQYFWLETHVSWTVTTCFWSLNLSPLTCR